MLIAARKTLLIEWLEKRWDTMNAAGRQKLLATRVEVVAAYSGHMALGVFTKEEHPEVTEITERFLANKRHGINISV